MVRRAIHLIAIVAFFTIVSPTLTAATNGGATLGSPYNADYAGNARSRYDMGAYEYITYPSMPLGSGATMSIGSGATMTVH